MEELILAVQRMQDYIESHIKENITLADLARASLYSPWYSYHIFLRLVGITPSEYIRKYRLSISAKILKNEDVRVVDVAYDFGYESVDGYQRAFKREFGCNPGTYLRNPVPINLFVPYGVKFNKLRKDCKDMKNVMNVFVQVINKEQRKAIIKRGIKAEEYFGYCEEVGCDVWGILTSMDSLCGEPICLWLTPDLIKPNTSVYVQGVEVPFDYSGAVPDGFDIITLPKSEYLMFQGEPFKEEDYSEAIFAVHNSMNVYNPNIIGYEWSNYAPKIQLEPRGERGYIEMRAVVVK